MTLAGKLLLPLAMSVATATPSMGAPLLRNLKPDGGIVTLHEDRTVNVVLINLPNVDVEALRPRLDRNSGVPASDVNTLSGVPAFAGFLARTRIDYRIVHTDAAFEEAFFAYLGAIAVPQTAAPDFQLADGSRYSVWCDFVRWGVNVNEKCNITPAQFAYNSFNSYLKRGDPGSGVFDCPGSAAGRHDCRMAGVNRRFIRQNFYLDAPSVERYLAEHLPVNTEEHTVVLINWWGRKDFHDHVYRKTNEPDPDTGVLRSGPRRDGLIAWGMTAQNDPQDCPREACSRPKRVWFYDVSAVEGYVGNWDLKDPHVPTVLNANGNSHGSYDQRFPPIWDYGQIGWRSFSDPLGDIAKGINDAFVHTQAFASYVYDPRFVGRLRHPSELQVDVNIYQGIPGAFGARIPFDPDNLAALLNRLAPEGYHFSVETNLLPFGDEVRRVYGTLNRYQPLLGEGGMPSYDPTTGSELAIETPGSCYLSSFWSPFPSTPWLAPIVGPIAGHMGNSCFGNDSGNFALADLVVYHDKHILQFVEGDVGPDGYEIPSFVFAVPDELGNPTFLGIADKYFADGGSHQFAPFAFVTPRIISKGIGITATLAHEVGHHIGLSHPHNGLFCSQADYLNETCTQMASFGYGEHYPSWYADMSSSVMSYLGLNADFGQRDQDAMRRGLVIAYLGNANDLLPEILRLAAEHPNSRVDLLLEGADADVGQALAAVQAMQYDAAVLSAKIALGKVLLAAETLRITVKSDDWRAPYVHAPHLRVQTRKLLRTMELAESASDGLAEIMGDDLLTPAALAVQLEPRDPPAGVTLVQPEVP